MKFEKSGKFFGFERFFVCVYVLLHFFSLLVNICSNRKEESNFTPGLTCIKHVAISANHSFELIDFCTEDLRDARFTAFFKRSFNLQLHW